MIVAQSYNSERSHLFSMQRYNSEIQNASVLLWYVAGSRQGPSRMTALKGWFRNKDWIVEMISLSFGSQVLITRIIN